MKPDYESIRKEIKRLKNQLNKLDRKATKLLKIALKTEAGKLSISPADGGELSIVDTGGLSLKEAKRNRDVDIYELHEIQDKKSRRMRMEITKNEKEKT